MDGLGPCKHQPPYSSLTAVNWGAARGPAHTQQVLTTLHILSHALNRLRSGTRASTGHAGLGSRSLGGRRARTFEQLRQQAP